MRIVLVCRGFPTLRPGGMLFVCQDRAEALCRLKHEVTVLTTGRPGISERSVEILHVWTNGVGGRQISNGYKVIYTPSPSLEYSREFAQSCSDECRRIGPDIIHLDSFDRSRPWWSQLGKPVFVTMHGFGPGSFHTKWNLWREGRGPAPDIVNEGMKDEAQALAGFKKVLAISRYEHFQLRSWYALKNTELVYNPIAPCFFNGVPSGDMTQPDGYLSVGLDSTSSNRNFQLADEACRLAGVPWRVARTTKRDMMPAIYRAAQAVILPTSWAQGYDLCVAEALACRRPVVASDVGSYALEGGGGTGIYLVPQNSPEAICALLKDGLPILPLGMADKHRSEYHANSWLSAVS